MRELEGNEPYEGLYKRERESESGGVRSDGLFWFPPLVVGTGGCRWMVVMDSPDGVYSE